MSIYRGPGGSGDAVNDAASEVLLVITAKDAAIAAQVAAETAQAAAQTAETNAETAETNAETAAALAATFNPALYVAKANNLSDLASTSTARTNLGLAIGTNVQAYDADLATIAGLTPTNNYAIIGNGTSWTSSALPASGVTSVTGTSPISSSGGATPAISLDNSGVSANTYGSSSSIPVITVSAKGLLTSVTTAAVNASNITTGTLSVASGGTGAATLTANNVIIGNGTSAVTSVAPGTTGNVLTSNGTTWTSAAPASSAPTTAQVLTALSGISSAGGVGNLCVGSYASSSNISVGSTTAGSNILGLDSAGSASAPFSGTWRNLGTSTLSTSGFSAGLPLLVRIS